MDIKKLATVCLLILTAASCGSRHSTTPSGKINDLFCVGFYNVENLFDTINQVGVIDEDYTPTGKNRWTAQRYQHKLDRLASVISRMKNGQAPELLGLAEVENVAVLQDLVKEKELAPYAYGIVHYDSPDRRGIDCALLYQKSQFKVLHSSVKAVRVAGMPDFKTRDILLVEGEHAGERLHLLVAHWPSRYGGEQRSMHLRMTAAQCMRQMVDSIVGAQPGAKIILMGDFNDDPVNSSITKGLRAHKEPRTLSSAAELYAPMMALYQAGYGTLAYRDSWNLFDNMLVNKNLLPSPEQRAKGLKLYQDPKTSFRAFIYSPQALKQGSGPFKGYPYRSYAAGVYQGGYSDHFPVYLFLYK